MHTIVSSNQKRTAGSVVVLASCALIGALAPLTAHGDIAPPFSRVEAKPSPTDKIDPTAIGHLNAVKQNLEQAQKSLSQMTTNNYGEHLTAAKASITLALDDLKVAFAYVKAHPGENVLKAGPNDEDKMGTRPVDLPSSDRVPGINIMTAVEALNNALFALLNNPAKDYHGPVLGELGGSRAKLIKDTAAAANELLAGINSVKAAPTGFRFGGLTAGPANTETADDLPPRSRLNSMVASMAMSLGMCLGGLHFFTRRKAKGSSASS